MRVGPSRLTSTARSSGESKLTVGGGVDDDVARGERRTTGVVEPEAVGGDVAGDDLRPVAATSSSKAALPPTLVAQPVEAVVLEDLPLGPLLDRPHPPAPHQQDELAVRHGSEQPLDQRRPEETGGAGDGDALAGELVADHGGHRRPLSTIW